MTAMAVVPLCVSLGAFAGPGLSLVSDSLAAPPQVGRNTVC